MVPGTQKALPAHTAMTGRSGKWQEQSGDMGAPGGLCGQRRPRGKSWWSSMEPALKARMEFPQRRGGRVSAANLSKGIKEGGADV